jgi:hypothetical protein
MGHIMAGYRDAVSESVFERDNYEANDEGFFSPEDELAEGPTDVVLEQGYSPPEKPRGLDAFGTTMSEERQGETLDQRLAQEEPDPAMQVDLGADGTAGDEDFVAGEVGDARAGRLVAPDAGGSADLEKDLVASDVGIDGAAASAEEAAMHVVDLEEADAALARDCGPVP